MAVAVPNVEKRKQVSYVSREAIIVNEDIIFDPTVSRDYKWVCKYEIEPHPDGSLCPGREAVFYQLPEKQAGSESMVLIFVCTTCRRWKKTDTNWSKTTYSFISP